jgi:lipopolysaccharide/colanic/teichoic acid biosynthesis glycosyltransferase
MERRWYDLVKRWLDIIGATAFLIVAAPALILAAIFIRLDGGPVLFRQERMGRNGTTFTLYKLRTMVPGAHRLESNLKQEQSNDGGYGVAGEYCDPRVTRIGALLRLLNVDELPQLLNIIKGDMSLIGPRPVPFLESLLYNSHRDEVLSVRPGLTGYWQVMRRISTLYDERVEMDCYYVRGRSLWLDLYILLRTPLSMLTSDYNSCTKPLPPIADGVVVSERVYVTAPSELRAEKVAVRVDD